VKKRLSRSSACVFPCPSSPRKRNAAPAVHSPRRQSGPRKTFRGRLPALVARRPTSTVIEFRSAALYNWHPQRREMLMIISRSLTG